MLSMFDVVSIQLASVRHSGVSLVKIRVNILQTKCVFYVHVTVQRNKILCNKTNWMH